jgi:hypothetical protein
MEKIIASRLIWRTKDNWLITAASQSPRSLEHLECVRPLVADEARDTPEHAERLDRARGFYASHVLGLPAELVEP